MFNFEDGVGWTRRTYELLLAVYNFTWHNVLYLIWKLYIVYY